MTQRLHDKIRHHLETTAGLTQRGLAERMGVNPAAVNRMLYGRRNIKADELPIIEDYLGIRLENGRVGALEYRQDAPVTPRGFSDVRRSDIESTLTGHALPPPVPVYADRRRDEVIDWAVRHPHQFAVRDAYALYVESEEMQPRYFRGELVYVHPARPVMTGGDCVIEHVDGRTLLRRLVQKTADTIVVQQFTPARMEEFALRDVVSLQSIVGRG